MKRGLISWDRAELPPAAFEARLGAIDQLCADFNVPAVAAYSDVCRSNDVRYISNFMPYWNRALTVVQRGEKPILLCALSPRVYPWIKSVTIHQTILPSPSLSGQLVKLCAERRWTRIGMVDHAGLPNDLYTQLGAAELTIVDVPREALRPSVTDAEVVMHRRAAQLARDVLEAELTRTAIGLSDYELIGRLERRFRRAGAEELVLLISDGGTVPLPAAGRVVGPHCSVMAAVEYNGHWAKVSRNIDNALVELPPLDAPDRDTSHRESLSGRYPWEAVTGQVVASRDRVVAIQVMIPRGESRLYYGDTGIQGPSGWRRL